ncbi:MAG: DUF2339 domain-containing protein, partial [Planctomycetia bacterium]
TVVKVFFLDVWQLAPIVRYISFMALGVALLSASFLYRRFQGRLRSLVVDETDADPPSPIDSQIDSNSV